MRSTRLSALVKGLVFVVALTSVGLVAVANASTSTPGQLDSGATLGSGATLYSPGGKLALTMQGDGNLVLYAPGHVPIWATGTKVGGAVLAEQGDGNLVVIAPGNHPVWASGTDKHPGTVLQVQDDGNVVQYAPGHVAIWSTGTSIGTSGASVAGNLAAANQGKTACGRNSLGGTSFYSSCTGNNGKPENWCADFTKWVWANSGFNVSGLTPAAYSFYTYGQTHNTRHSAGYQPRVGDAIVYNVNYGAHTARHVGIVVSVGGGVIRTENGNFGGHGNPGASTVVPENLPANASINYQTSFGMKISEIVSPFR